MSLVYMIATIVISVVTLLLITLSILFFPRIKIGKISLDTYWIIALLGAIILLAASLSPIKEVYNQFVSDTSINPLKILVLFFSMTIISIFLDEFGLFRYLACLASKKAKGNQLTLFFIFYLLTSLLTVFTSNDIVILTFTPFICFFCKRSNINPLPYLIAEFAAANTWSLMFIIGNPTNIYLATSAKIDFISYFKVMALPTLLGGITELGIIYLLFRKKLKTPIEVEDEDYHIESKLDLWVGVIHLLVCLIFLVISSYIDIEMWLISLISASSLFIFILFIRLIRKDHWCYLSNTFKRLPYQLIPFFLSMFVVVVALNYQGVSTKIEELLGNNNVIWVYGYSSFLASNVINNIPMSILYSNLPMSLEAPNYLRAVYATIVGSNIGAFLTPIGALAGIMFSSLIRKYDVKFTFIDFIKYGAIISIPTITVILGGLYIPL